MNAAVVASIGWRATRRSLWANGRPRRGLVAPAFTLLLFVFCEAAARALFVLAAQTHAGEDVAARVLGWAFALAFGVLLASALPVVLEVLVAAPDLERLRAAPLTPRQILALKLVATLPQTLAPVLGIALAAAVAHARVAGGISPAGLAAALLALWAVPLGLALALVLPLLALVPAARVRESLAVLATLAFVAGWLASTFGVPRVAVGDAGAVLAALPALPEGFPATWAARAVMEPWPRAGGWIAACLLAAAAALALGTAAATHILAELHARAASVLGRRVRAGARRAPTLGLAFLRRDLALVMRDWPVTLDALAGLLLWSLLPLALVPVAPLPRLELARDVLIALSVSLGHDIAARSLPLERQSLAWARLSPVGGARWLAGRAQLVALVNGTLVTGASLLAGGLLGLGGHALLDVFCFGLAAATTASAAGLLLGVTLGDPAWTQPRAMLGPGGRAASLALLLALAAGWVGLAHAHFTARPLGALAIAALLALAAAVASALCALAAGALARRETPS